MTKSSKKSGMTPTVKDQLRSRLDDEDRADDATPLHFMIEFWSRLRAEAANSHSVGLDALDRLVLRLLADDTSQTPLESAVVIPPSPESMSAGQVREHSVFQAPVTQSRSGDRCLEDGVKRSSSRTPLKPPPAKKKRTSKKAKSKPHFSVDLPTGVDATIERNLERLVKISEGQGKTLPRMAFPWKGYRVWYDPKYHLEHDWKHWRFWMCFRLRFLPLALYPPSEYAAAHRKLKASAFRARLQLLSAFFEEMGYCGMLTAFEDAVHDNLMLLGGRAAKNASGADDDSNSPDQEDLGVLLKRYRRRYDQAIANALDPFEVGSSDYHSIPELLKTGQAIDPTRLKNLRLSDKALARIAMDVSGSNPPKESWVGNRNRGPWKEHLSDRSLRVTQVEVARLLTAGKPVIVHNDRPFQPSEQGEDDSDFKENGEFIP
ncbi:uncharacterized protein PITG_18429 [Phytophthora infestans T30-4]|uniref:Uncharacterized protein n=1 Tax=Phytophthora infestans (strain T30-4) TaxID=403677 RepID=D0NX03_PHYIT|nr:uncharacterized protein PITG_18429 [Phytophthora infestans T30-4]EEY67595.1 conserved hypothetical protein [Phytophthora infestans T30-4]|eukprot:XP_002896360.1 conserved hypothetical protein [Phytophthora infestans T30-4]